MRYITPSILFALFTLGFLFYFLWRYFTALHNRPADLQWVRGERKPLRFAGSCHPTDRKDRILLLLITLLYACTAFSGWAVSPLPRPSGISATGRLCLSG